MLAYSSRICKLKAHKGPAGNIRWVGCDTRVLVTEELEHIYLFLKVSLYLPLASCHDNAGLVLSYLNARYSI